MASTGQQSELLNTQLLVDSIPALIHTARPDGYLDYFNKPWLEYLGVTLDKVTGWNWTAFVHPEDVEGIVAKWRACLATGEIFEYETRVRRANGEYRWMFHRKVPLRDASGKIVKWYGSSLDIEDRKTVEEKIRAQKRELRDVLDSIPAVVWSALPDGSNTFVNSRWVEYSGLPAEQMAGSGWHTVTHPDDVERHKVKWLACVTSGEPSEDEVRFRRADGEYRWHLQRGVPLRDEAGNIVKWYGVLTDIEDRKRAEEAQRRNEFYLAEGQRLAHTGSWGLNLSGSFDYWSEELFRIYGLDPATGAPSLEGYLARVHPRDREFMAELIREMLAKGLGCDVKKRIVRPDGGLRYIRCVGVPVIEKGALKRIIGTAMDVTEQEQLTQDLHRREAYLTEAQRLSHTGSFGCKTSSGEMLWSEETFRIYGYDHTTTTTVEAILQRVHPKDKAGVQAHIARATSEGTACDLEYRLLLPDDSIKHVHVVAHPVKDESAGFEFVGAVTDITERKVAEEEIRRSEAYLAEAQRLSHTGSFGWKPDRGEIVWSDETYRIFEYDRGTKPVLDMVVQRAHLDDKALVQQVIDRVSETGTAFEHEYRLLMPDGRVKHVHAIAHALQDASGNREFVGAVTDITERKKAEEALRSSEAYLAEAQKLSHTGSWAWSPEQDIRYWSEECFHVLSFDPQGGLPRFEEFFQRIHPDDQPGFRELIQTAIREKAEFEADYRIEHPDGPDRDIHVVAHPVLSTSGHLIEFVGTVIDVTERKRADEERRRSEMELRQVLDLAPQHVAVFGSGRERLYANRIMLDYLGLTLEEWRQRFDYGEFVHSDDWVDFLGGLHGGWEQDAGHFDRPLSSGASFELELRLRKGDGSYRWFLARYNPVCDDKGRITRCYVAFTDIEERKQAEDTLHRENVALKRAEQKIREQEAELRSVITTIPTMVWSAAPDGSVDFFNPRWLDYTGLSSDQSRDWRWTAAIHPDDLSRLTDAWQSILVSGEPGDTEARLRRFDGAYRWFQFRANPLRDESGKIFKWYGTNVDIEDRKQAEGRLRQENVALREEIDQASMFEDIVGTSPALKTVLSNISKVARSDSTVLITGETGTGKELVARAVHKHSQRSSHAFISVNCAATPRDLIASELFGHEKGAFTGATQQRLGRFELATGGTIFLDEVGELPAETQVALLRVLQEHEFERVGGTRRLRADVRVIAATNRDLEAAISAGSFRTDLFYRLNVFPIEIPPLRDRKEDIPLLVEYFIDRYARKAGKNIKHVNKKTLELLKSYPWPGNIRELQNVIERSVILCETELFSIDEHWLTQQPSLTTKTKNEIELPRRLLAHEKDIIEDALRESRGRVFGPRGAAAKLGIPRSTLESKIRSLKIDKNRFKI